MKKILKVVSLMFFVSEEVFGQGLKDIADKLTDLQSEIMKIMAFILAIIFVAGIIHVVAAKADGRDPERFKRLIVNYIIAIIFVVVALSMISLISTMVRGTGL